MRYVSSAYLQSAFPLVTACKSDASTTYDAGPIADPWMMLAETVMGRWWMSRKTREDRQTGGQIDGQSAIETVTDSQWTLRKKHERTERQTERQLVVETMSDSWRKNKRG